MYEQFFQARKLQLLMDFKQHRSFAAKVSIFILLILLLIFILAFGSSRFYNEVKYSLLLSHIYQMFQNLFFIAQFFCAASAIGIRFKLLKEFLDKSIPNKQSKEFFKVQQKISSAKLFYISELYSDLSDAVLLINETFTWQLIIVMLNIITVDIFAGYAIVREFIFNQNEVEKYLILCNATWIILQFVLKFIMAEAALGVTVEAENCLVRFERIIQISASDTEQLELSLLLIRMRGRNVTLRNVFFKIDYNLILAVSFQ